MTMTVGFIGLGQKRPETDLNGKNILFNIRHLN